MRLWTIQGYDLREFRGPITLEEGTYKDKSRIQRAQRKLYDLIGEDQLVWCALDEPCLLGEIGRYLHQVEVDSRDVVTIVDGLVWNHIIATGSRYIPSHEHAALRSKARTSGQDYDSALPDLEDDYLAKHLPEDLWSGVTKTEIDKKSDQILAKFPFNYSTILDVQEITEELAKGKHIPRVRYSTIPWPREGKPRRSVDDQTDD